MDSDGNEIHGSPVKIGKQSMLIDTSRCTGCGRCVAACRDRLITLDPVGNRKIAWLKYPERCSLCGKCLAECPVGAIAQTQEHPHKT
jgi:NAD-dependent dihydropyrimidine dehydrogenase PreA subunit